MNDLDIPALSEAEKRAILDAASQAYEKLRREVGDSEVMRKELVLLARDSYCAGRAALTPPIVAVITSKAHSGGVAVSGSMC